MSQRKKWIIGISVMLLILVLVTTTFFVVTEMHPNLPVSQAYREFKSNGKEALVFAAYSGALAIYLSLVFAFLRLYIFFRDLLRKPTIINNVLVKTPKNDIIYKDNENLFKYNHVTKRMTIKFTCHQKKNETINELINKLYTLRQFE